MAVAHAPRQPSFLNSVASGIGGFAKGLFAGGALGAIAGALVGLSIGLVTGGVGTAVMAGAGYGAALFASVGSWAGMATEVVKSRETAANSAQNVASVANIAFTQGVSVGRNIEAAEGAGVSFREREEQRRAAQAWQQQTR